MLIKRSITVLTAAVSVASTAFLFSGLMGLDQSVMAESSRVISFECQVKRGLYTTVASRSGKSIDLFVWDSNRFASSGYTNERRCDLVSKRLQSYSFGKLRQDQLTHGIMNGEKIICTALSKDSGCNKLVYTLHPEDNARDKLQAVLGLTKGNVSASIHETSERLYVDINNLFDEMSSGNSDLSNDQNSLFNDSVFK